MGEDPEYVRKNQIPINVKHYFNQLASPLTSLLEPVFSEETYNLLCKFFFFIYFFVIRFSNIIVYTKNNIIFLYSSHW